MATDPNLLMALINGPTLAGNIPDQQLQRDQARQQLAIGNFQLAQEEQAAQQRQQYQADVANLFAAHPNQQPQDIMNLIAKYPQQYQALQAGWRLKDQAQRTSDLGFYSDVHGALSKGNNQLAVSTIERRLAAEKAAGLDTSQEEAWLDQLKGGDPNAARAVQALALGQIAAATGPDKFSDAYKTVGGDTGGFTLGPGSRRFDESGKLVAEAPFAPRPVTVGEGQTVVEYDPNGENATGGNQIDRMLAITPFSESGNREFNADGTRVTSPKGARGVMQVMPHTAGNPGYGIAPSNGSPEDDARLGRQYLGKMLEIYGNPAQAWAAYNVGPGAVDKAIRDGGSHWLQKLPSETRQYVAKNMAALNRGGQAGPRVIAQGAPRQQYQLLSQAQKSQMGLDPNIQYQQAPNGQITALGGQQGRQVKQIPDAVANKLQPSIDARDTLAASLSSFKPDYGGHWALGDRANDIQAITGIGAPGMRDWWARIYSMDNIVRNQLFGSALTATEQAAWERTTVKPSMRPEAIRSNLTQRQKILTAVLNRRENFLKKNGYDPDAVDALFSPLEEATPQTAQPQPSPQQRPQFRIIARRPAR